MEAEKINSPLTPRDAPHVIHTPGPWVWYSEDASMATLCRKTDDAFGCDPLTGHVLSVTICKGCHEGHDHWAWGRCYTASAADARLIAAAPDLLAALKDLLHELDTDDIGGLVEGQMERARALIAKATASSDRPEA